MSKSVKEQKPKRANPILDDVEELEIDELETETEDTTDEEVETETESNQGSQPVEIKIETGKKRSMIEKIALPKSNFGNKKINSPDAGLNNDQRRMKEKLENDPKFPIMIPLGAGEQPGAVHECFLNGLFVEVPKGELVNVPQGVFELLMESLKLNNEAGREMLISRSADVEDALTL